MMIWRADADWTRWEKERFKTFDGKDGPLADIIDTHHRTHQGRFHDPHFIVPTLNEVGMMQAHAAAFREERLLRVLDGYFPMSVHSPDEGGIYRLRNMVVLIPEKSPLEQLREGEGRIAFGVNLPTVCSYLKTLRQYADA